MSEQQVKETTKPRDFEADINDLGSCKKIVRVTYPASFVSGSINKEYAQIKRTAHLKGFRKGKAPRRVLARLYGEQINEYVRSNLIHTAIESLTDESPVVVPPEPTDVQFDPKGELSFEVTLVLKPTIELPNFDEANFEVTVKKPNVSDEEVQNQIDSMLASKAEHVEVEDGTVELNDKLMVDLELWLPEELSGYDEADDDSESAFEPILEVEDYEFVLAKEETTVVNGLIVKGLSEDMLGRKLDDVVRVDVVIPDDFEVIEARGRAGVLCLDICRIMRMKNVELNEETISSLGYDSEEALRSATREKLLDRASAQKDVEIANEVLKSILNQVGDFELPRDIVQSETDQATQRIVQESKGKGMSEAQIEREVSDRAEEIQADAIRGLRRFFVIDEVSRAAEIEVSEDEIRDAVNQFMMMTGIDVGTMQKLLKEGSLVDDLRWQVQERKTLKYLRELAKVTEEG